MTDDSVVDLVAESIDPPSPPPASASAPVPVSVSDVGAASSSIRALTGSTRSLLSSDVLLPSPSSFIRELIENGLDAGGTNIQLQMILAGDGSGAIGEIDVKDNGRGIHREDTDNIARPHCTSKIKAFDDIVSSACGVSTFGFRGEALYCISGSCASMSIQSKCAGAPVAFKAQWVNGVRGAMTSIAQAGSGTTVHLKGLYHNRPVRAKMAKKDAPMERTKIAELLRGYAFVYPHVRFICNEPPFNKPASSSGQSVFESGLDRFRDSIPLVIGTATGSKQMMEIQATATNGFRVEGFITRYDAEQSNKELFRSKADRLFFYITDTRSIGLPWLSKLLVSEWRTLSTKQLQRRAHRANGINPDSATIEPAIAGLLSSRFPLAVLKLSVPSPESLLDLNRSPDKRDILVGDEATFRAGINEAIKLAMQQAMEKIEEGERIAAEATRPSTDAAGIVQAEPMELDSASNVSLPPPPASVPTPDASDVVLNDAPRVVSPPLVNGSNGGGSRLLVKVEPDDVEILGRSTVTPARPGDFSTFIKPLTQPQIFSSNRSPIKSGGTAYSSQAPPVGSTTPPKLTPPSPPASASSINPSSPSSNHSGSKRPRLSTDSPSSTHIRHSQVSLVDVVNSSISFAPRILHMDADLIHQIQTSFANHQALRDTDTTPTAPHFIAALPKPGLGIIRLPKEESTDPTISQDEAQPTSMPTLCVFSQPRIDEVLLLHHSLVHYPIPSVPLDESIPVDDQFPDLSASERDQLMQDVLEAERLHLEQRVPTGCLTFQQAMELCGFRLVAASDATPLSLVAVPSDPSISITDFLATLRHIWSDDCFQRTKLLKVTNGSSNSSSVVGAWSANTDWRVEGIRRAILQHVQATNTANPYKVTLNDEAVKRSIKRIEATIQTRTSDFDSEADWTQILCTHHKRIAYRITNQIEVKKQE